MSFTPHKKIKFPADLVTFTEETLNGKLHFLCNVCPGTQKHLKLEKEPLQQINPLRKM